MKEKTKNIPEQIKDYFVELPQSDAGLYLLVAMLSATVFVIIYGFRVIIPTNADWLLAGGDLSQHYLGWVAYRASRWFFPIGMLNTLAYPIHTSVIFTDSIPLFAFFFKLLSPLLPTTFQYFGIFGVFCFVMQGVLAAKIVRAHTDEKSYVIFSSLLVVLSPVMILRMYMHTALAAHWILLLALEPIFARENFKDTKKLALRVFWIALCSATVHMYFVMLSGILMLGICLQQILEKKYLISLFLLFEYLGLIAFFIWIFGGFSSGANGVSEGLGDFSANLNTLYNPTCQGNTWSQILPQFPLYHMGQYEGFGYLGFGTILLCIGAFSLKLGGRFFPFVKKHYQTVLVSLVICVIALIFALSPKGSYNDRLLFTIPLPEFLFYKWAIFRASGRAIWILVYTFSFAAILTVLTMKSIRNAIVFVMLCLVLQVFDIIGALEARQKQYAQPIVYKDHFRGVSFWETLGREPYKHVLLCLDFNGDNNRWFSITDWALSHGKTVNNFDFAREMTNEVNAYKEKALKKLPKDTIYIFSDGEMIDCLNYDLHFYHVDDYVIGTVKKLNGFPEMKRNEFSQMYFFKDDYISKNGGEDTDEKRILYPGGAYFGPFWKLAAGEYELKFSGENMVGHVMIEISSENGQHVYPFQTRQQTENEVTIAFTIPKNTENFEMKVQNISDENVAVIYEKLQCVK